MKNIWPENNYRYTIKTDSDKKTSKWVTVYIGLRDGRKKCIESYKKMYMIFKIIIQSLKHQRVNLQKSKKNKEK